MAKFIVIDHSFFDFTGHCYDYSMAIANAAKENGYDSFIVGHFVPQVDFSNSKELDGIQILPWFYYANGQVPRQFCAKRAFFVFVRCMPVFVRGAILSLAKNVFRRFFIDVVQKRETKTISSEIKSPGLSTTINKKADFGFRTLEALAEIGAKKNDHVFVHTLGITEFARLVTALKISGIGDIPMFHILLRYDPRLVAQTKTDMQLLISSFTKVSNNDYLRCRIKFYSDTEGLAKEYGAIGNTNFKTLPIPLLGRLFSGEMTKKNSTCLTLTYLGSARLEKGFHLLADLAEALREKYLQTGKVKLVIQANRHGNLSLPVEKCFARLTKFPSKHVALVERPLNTQEYHSLLSSSSLILLPYDPIVYRIHSSGVLAQSIAAGKPVVFSANTWMAEKVTKRRGVAFGGEHEFIPAVIKAIQNYEKLSVEAESYKACWLEKNNPDALFALLMGVEPV